ncbi:MAG: glutamate racemase [Prevotellaceae bacterium]|jgi:glutamate racemase|nr:glutamate racemase [Prevotellaceae bacterium]
MIGIFDSGVGGLSVLKEVVKLLPNRNTCYVADTANCPYGTKAAGEVLRLSIHVVDFLLDKGCNIIIVACNTATSAAIDELRVRYPDVPFVGMEPAVKPAAQHSHTKRIGILATAGTVKGRLFNQTKERYAADVKVYAVVGAGLVELVEEGKAESEEVENLLRIYLQPMLEDGVDELVLGCTHYPFLQKAIEKITQGRMDIVNPTPAVAAQTKRLMEQKGLLSAVEGKVEYLFYSSGNVEGLRMMQEQHVPLVGAKYGQMP